MNGKSRPGRGSIALALAGALLAVSVGAAEAQDRTGDAASPYFEIHELARGVWAVIAADSLSAISNAGIIDLGDATVVFDAFFSPIPAESLREAAETLTGRPVDYLVLGHRHDDHIRGAQAFPDATVVATGGTRESILTREPRNISWQNDNIAEWLVHERDQLRALSGSVRYAEQRFWVDYYEAMAAALPILETVVPGVTFDGRMVLHGSERSVELLEVGAGHTASDLVLHVPDAGAVFMSDLLFIERHPYLGHGDPDALVEIMERVAALEPVHVVPGHGPVGETAHLRTMAEYVRTVEREAATLRDRGDGSDEAGSLEVPAEFAGWWYGRFYPANVRFMLRRLESAGGS